MSVTALQDPGWVGDTITRMLQAPGQTQLVSEVMVGWKELITALPAQLPGALPYEEWALRLLAGGPEATLRIFVRG